MSIAEEKRKIRETIRRFDSRIEKMHLDFQKFRSGEEKKIPDWESLERELIVFSRQKLFDQELINLLDQVLYKFQNRKRIWLRWVEERYR